MEALRCLSGHASVRVCKQPPHRAGNWIPAAVSAHLLFLAVVAPCGGIALADSGPGDVRVPSPQMLYAPLGKVLGAPLYRFTLADTIEIVARRWTPIALVPDLPRPWLGATPESKYQPALLLRTMTRPRTYERTRFARVILGADRLAGSAAALGGLGLVGGLWGERTAGYLMGAGAVLGALWGGTIGADDPGLRIGVQTEPRTLPLERRSQRITDRRD